MHHPITSYLFLLLILVASCQNPSIKESIIATPKIPQAIDSTFWLKQSRGIRDILEDKDGNLWFSSTDFVVRFDGKENYYFTSQDGLSIVGNLHMDTDGSIWVENGNEVFLYNGNVFEQIEIENLKSVGDLWIQKKIDLSNSKNADPGIYEITNRGVIFHPFPVNSHDKNKHLFFPSTKATIGNDSTVWFGTMEQIIGLKEGKFIIIGRDEMGRKNDKRNIGMRGIFIDDEGKLWMADNGAGIFVYDGEKVENFTSLHHLDEGDREGNTLHRAFSIAQDTMENMWFGTVYAGIWKFNIETEAFTNYTIDDGVKSEVIWTIYRTSEGRLLFAGESPAAVYEFNGSGFDRIH